MKVLLTNEIILLLNLLALYRRIGPFYHNFLGKKSLEIQPITRWKMLRFRMASRLVAATPPGKSNKKQQHLVSNIAAVCTQHRQLCGFFVLHFKNQ